MNESPWISIIIPVYNAGQYFEECLQTVCGNTQLDIEIILIDDGSTDGSGNTARKWAAKDVRVRYIQQENQGCSSARNHGIELALSACGVRRPENGLPETNFASMCWKLYRGDCLRRTNLKIDRELVRGEDLLFNCHAFSEAYSIAFSPYDYYNYRNNPQSATRRRNPAIKERDAVFQKKLQAFANQYRYRHLEQIGASYSALNGIAVSFEAYFSFFRLAEYRVFRLELTNFLQKDCYQRYLKKKCPGAQYLNRNSKILIFLLAHRMYFLSWLLFGVGRKIKRTLDTVSKS